MTQVVELAAAAAVKVSFLPLHRREALFARQNMRYQNTSPLSGVYMGGRSR
jgi:hypothetical protein